MQTAQFNLLLLTPAFLGDASQSGVWRTPPFKALLREWWRIAAAPGHSYEHRAVRPVEGDLFGNAWLDSGATQSKVRLALKHWHAGKMATHTPLPMVPHPKAERAGYKVEPLNYLRYGPIDRGQFKNGAALQAGEPNVLDIAWPETETSIPHTLQLIDWFGTIGGRCRNGWGSLALLPSPQRGVGAGAEGDGQAQRLTRAHPQLAGVLRDLRQCLELDWPHAIGKDETGPLIWESAEAFDNWQDAMKFLARTKIGFRTHLKFNGGQPHPQAQERHVLAYPVTNHAVQGWSRDARLANQLRFKLFRDEDKLRARIYHTPHQSPLPMGRLDQAAQLTVWNSIHGWLDDKTHGLHRLEAQP